ncbi:MAG TPA: hypothetical protein VHO25_12350 [Polyangiaceae bacterium]|nr:hypothetical protein [Polyangiaceae bacterium]
MDGAPSLTVEILYDVERVGDAEVVEKDCAYTVLASNEYYSEELRCTDVGFACRCSGMYRRDTSGEYNVTVTNKNGNSVSRSMWVPSACYEHEPWRFTFPMEVPPASVEDAIVQYCRHQAACFGETFQECLSGKINIRPFEIQRGCGATSDAVTKCEAQHPHECDELYSPYCRDEVAAHQRCGIRECGGFGFSPPGSYPIPCAYRCWGAAAECTGETEGDISCTCTEGPRAEHEFDVYDCDEFLSRYQSECAPMDASSP